MTVYRCIKCQTSWEFENGDADPTPSGSLCKPCLRESLTPLYRKRQLKEGNFDCFAKATGDRCDQSRCVYRRICLHDV